jgi:hypothetical protein
MGGVATIGTLENTLETFGNQLTGDPVKTQMSFAPASRAKRIANAVFLKLTPK